MTEMFVVCWVLLHQPVPDQENCTPSVSFAQAQVIASYVAEARDSSHITTRSGPTEPPRATRPEQ